MQNTCISSSVALRCKGSLSFSFNDYTYCSNERFCRHPFAYTSPLLLQSSSSSLTCCGCCANGNSVTYRVPITPSYVYGLRQSTLIQWTPCKKVILGGLDRVYNRLSGCDVDRRCYCEKVCNLREKGARRRRGGWGKGRYGCMVFEESSEMCSLDDVNDEAEVMLSLLTEEVNEDLFDLRGRNERSSKKVLEEKRGNVGGSGASYRGKKKNVGVLEGTSKSLCESGIIKSRQEDKRRQEEKRAEEMEAFSRRGGQMVSAREEQREVFLRENRKARARKEEREESLIERRKETVREEARQDTLRESRKVSAREEEREELLRREEHRQRVREEAREDTLRESRKASAREEEREDLLRREEHRQRVRKDGSSCSSYYSVSSTGEFESEAEIQDKQEEFEELSRKYKKDSRRHGEITFDGEVEERVERHGDYSKEQGVLLRKGNTAVGDEWNWRKESEKKLTDISAEETRSQKELSHKQSNYFDVHDGVYGKASYKKYDGREEQTTSAVKFDEGSRRQNRQTGDDVVGQSETRIKYKKSTELSESHGANIATSSGSQKQQGGRAQISTKATSSVQEAREEHYDNVDLINREEEYRRKSNKIAQSSNTQKIDISKTSTSQLRSETTERDQEKASTTSLSSVYDAKEKHHQAGHFTRQQDSRQTSQQFHKDIDIESISLSRSESEHRVKKKAESSNPVYGSYQESSERHFQANEDEAGRLNSGMRVDKRMNTSVVHYSGTGTTGADEGSRRKSEAVVTPPSSQLVSRGALHAGSTSALVIEEVSHGSLRNDTAASHQHTLDRPSALQHETLGGTRRDETIGQPLKFVSQEDALGSADRLQKTSTYYVGEFVEKVRHEISSSEIHREKKNNETEVAHYREQYEQKALAAYVSGDSQLKEHDSRSRHSSAASGTKGPSDEMWDVTEPSNQEPPEAEVLEETNSAGNVITKRTGRSMWNIIGDIVRLRWASRSTNHSAAGKSGGRSSPNQSTNSEAWFSGHEPDENIHESMYVIPQEEAKIRSQSQGQSSSSSSSKDHIKPVGGGSLSYAEVVAQGTASGSTLLPSGEGNFVEHNEGTTSGAAMAGSSIPLPAIRLRRSPVVQNVSEAGVVDAEVVAQGTASGSTFLPSGEGHLVEHNEGTASGAAMAGSSIPLPGIRLRRSPVVQNNSEAGVVDASAGGKVVQTELPLSYVVSEISQPEGRDGELKQKKLQRTNQVMKDRFDEWEEAYRIETEQRKIDEMFMREALLEAKKAADSWEVPVGAVLVHDGKIIARGYNLVEELRDSTAHAEMICIREASNILRTWRLSETTLYVTLEPCPMCAGAILQARVDTVVWGAPNKLLGADGSWIRLFPSGEGESSLEPSDKPAPPVHPFHPKIKIRRNVLESECAEKMQQFFQLRRRKKEKKEKKQDPTTPPSCLPIAHHPSKFFTKMHDVFHIMFCL